MEVRIKHPTVEGNDLGYVDVDTDDYDFESNEGLEFHETQPSKAATKWVADYKKNPDVSSWPTKKA